MPKIQVTLSQQTFDRFERERGHEAMSSFCRRLLEGSEEGVPMAPPDEEPDVLGQVRPPGGDFPPPHPGTRPKPQIAAPSRLKRASQIPAKTKAKPPFSDEPDGGPKPPAIARRPPWKS